MKKICVLGSTGSIGCNTLDVVRNNPGRLQVKSLVAGSNIELLAKQAEEFKPDFVAVADPSMYSALKNALKGTGIRCGASSEGVLASVEVPETDTVVAAIVGAAGLLPVMRSIELGRQICLANKETLVVGGSIVIDAAEKAGVNILPVDSEHSAIFQCLCGADQTPPEKIIITASGGPFRGWTREQLTAVTVEQALKHPNWSMGGKITIDSATLMNKGLEVIEAHWLFKVPYERIEVVVHPQSIIHSMVEFSDGSVIAQLGWPDMKLPIQYALSWPERWGPVLKKLDLASVGSMTFQEPDLKNFPCLEMAFEAGKAGGIMPCVLNAANEIAVSAFLNKKISFVEIAEIVENTIQSFRPGLTVCLDILMKADTEARQIAAELVSRKGA